MNCEELTTFTQEGEHWKQIYNFSNYYISDLGRVYNCKRHKFTRLYDDGFGYVLTDLKNDDGVVKSKRVHRLVAEAFLSDWNSEWPWTVNHINGKKDDNRLCNLEMLTTQDNCKHYQTAECFEQSRKDVREKMSAIMKEKCNEPEYNSKMSDRMKKVWQDPNNREMYVNCLYKRHSDPEERKHISDKLKAVSADPEYRKGMSERQKQNWDSFKYRESITKQNQDRIWVHKGKEERWIHEYELLTYLSNGYEKGRSEFNITLTTKGKVRVSNGVSDKFILPEEVDSYLETGWRLGKADRKQVKCIQTGEIFSSVEECAAAFNTNVDLIRSRCNGAVKNFRKLKEFNFCYYESEDLFADMEV